MTKGQQRRVDTRVAVGSTTVRITGESIHAARDSHRCAELLAEVLDALEYAGEYKVVASMQRLKGSSSLQGLSTHGASINAVQLGYQPNGNDSRATYVLSGFKTAEDAQKCVVLMKAYIGNAYNGAAIVRDEPLVPEIESPVLQPVSTTTFVKPTEMPPLGYFSDKDWMDTTVLHFLEAEDDNRTLTESQVRDIVFRRTHYHEMFQTDAVFAALVNEGFLIPVEGGRYKVKPEPKSQKTKAKNAKSKPKAKHKERRSFLNDEQWVRSCMLKAKTLVDAKSGLVTESDVIALIREMTPYKSPSQLKYVERILSGLKVAGYIRGAGAHVYKVTFDASESAIAKTVDAVAVVKAEVAKIFDGFAMYKLPKFAEVMFDNLNLLDRVLRRLNYKSATSTAMLYKAIAVDYPARSKVSYAQLTGYLCAQGYLVKSRHGHYSLGPKGRERLSLPRVDYKTVPRDVSESVLQANPPQESPVAELQAFLAQPQPSPVVAKTQPKPPVANTALTGKIAKVPAGVAEAAARTIAKAAAKKAEADVMEAEEVRLLACRDELKAQIADGPSPEAVEAAFMEKLVAMANDL